MNGLLNEHFEDLWSNNLRIKYNTTMDSDKVATS